MKSDRTVIAAVLFLAGGLGLLIAHVDGTTGLSVAYPVTATKLHADVTVTGWPVLAGVPMVAAGLLLLVIALIVAIVSQFRAPEPNRIADVPAKRQDPFEE